MSRSGEDRLPLGALRQAAIAGATAVVLTLPIVGLRTVSGATGLVVEPHLRPVALIAALVFVASLVQPALARGWREWRARRQEAAAGHGAIEQLLARHGRLLRWAGLAILVLLPFVTSGEIVDRAILVLIYVILGWGLNIVVGFAGLLNLGYAAFYGIGAYTVGLLSMDLGWGFWSTLPCAAAVACGFGLALGFPILRLRGDYLAIVTMGFGEIIRIVLVNWQSLTMGPNGIGSIPSPTLFNLSFSSMPPHGTTGFAAAMGLRFSPIYGMIFLYFTILALAGLTHLLIGKLRRLPLGRAWEALREDEIACRALGIDPTLVKLSAFALGALFAGVAGACFAARMHFISPESFTFAESATVLAIVVLGGMGSQAGVALAAAFLVLLPELLRPLADYRMLLFGAAMVAIMILRPRGLFATRRPSIRLGEAVR